MIFVATFGIGLAAGLTRSVLSVVAACLAILLTFALAVFAGGGASVLALLAAVGGYNLGLIALVCAQIAAPRQAGSKA